MLLTGPQLARIHETLLDAFSRDELRRVVKASMDVDFLRPVSPDKTYEDQVYAFVEWVDRRNRTADLIAGALQRNQRNAGLRRLALDALRWPALAAAAETLFIADRLAARADEETVLAGLIDQYRIWLQRYTPLSGTVEVRRTVADTTLDFGAFFIPTGFEKLVEHGYGPQQRIERVPVKDLSDAIGAHPRLVVLGEPGSGKTTTL